MPVLFMVAAALGLVLGASLAAPGGETFEAVGSVALRGAEPFGVTMLGVVAFDGAVLNGAVAGVLVLAGAVLVEPTPLRAGCCDVLSSVGAVQDATIATAAARLHAAGHDLRSGAGTQ